MVSGPPSRLVGAGLDAVEDEGVLDDMERREKHQDLRVRRI